MTRGTEEASVITSCQNKLTATGEMMLKNQPRGPEVLWTLVTVSL